MGLDYKCGRNIRPQYVAFHLLFPDIPINISKIGLPILFWAYYGRGTLIVDYLP